MNIEDIKKIKMVPDKPYVSTCDVKIYDEVNGEDRKRFAIKLEYSKYDIDELKKEGLGYEEIIVHYKDWIYSTIRIYLCYEWECDSGYDEVIKILEEAVKKQF
ncbi:MAG: hypothetical protein JJE03_04420 [Peptostreptococcaceae bacterium]|nr:hypothetical protein [Peptostreptococcaceae bacterium]